MMTTRRMAALLATAIAIVPMHAFAQDWGRVLSDPNYLPLTGEFDGSTAYDYGMLDRDTFDGAGNKVNSFKLHSNVLTQSFDYGVTDDFDIGANISYDPMTRRTVELPDGSSFSRDQSGFTDPTIFATYRFLDERRGPMIADLFGSYSPDLFSAKLATTADDGTVARGGQAAAIGLAVGREWPNFGIRGTASANWIGDRKFEDPTTASTQNKSAAWNYDVGLGAQARFTDRASLNFGAGYLFRQNYKATDATTDTSFAVHPGDVGNVHVALNYHFVPNRFVGSLSYQYNHYNQTSNIDTESSALVNQLRNQNENVFGAKLSYVLN